MPWRLVMMILMAALDLIVKILVRMDDRDVDHVRMITVL